MNEQIHASGRTSLSSDHAASYTDGIVTHVQDSLPSLPTLHYGLKEASDLLKRLFRGFNGSLALRFNHGITHDVEGRDKTSSTEFINRYVFLDGQLDTVSNIQRLMENARFEIADVEALRPHYALTLRTGSRRSNITTRKHCSTPANRAGGSGAFTWLRVSWSSNRAKSVCIRSSPASAPMGAPRCH